MLLLQMFLRWENTYFCNFRCCDFNYSVNCYSFFVFKKHKKVSIVKHSYETSMVSDTQPHKPVENTVLDFPQDELKYSFTFFLEISDFYSNKGYWKCIMIKGDSFNDLKKQLYV